MFKRFRKLYVPEWFLIFNPKGLVLQIIKFIKLLLPFHRQSIDASLAYKDTVYKTGYTPIVIKSSDIISVEKTIIAGDNIIGSEDNIVTRYNYQCKVGADWLFIGCGYTNHNATQGIDYIIKDGVYWFIEHPSKYCYTTIDKDEIVYKTVAFGGPNKQVKKAYSPVSATFGSLADAELYNTVIDVNLGGLDNTVHLHTRGITTTGGLNGTVIKTWKQGYKTYAITSEGTFISTTDDNNIHLVKNQKITLNSRPTKFFTINVNNIYYPVSMLANRLSSYPGIDGVYSNLKIVDNYFIGFNLYEQLCSNGYKFTEMLSATSCDISKYNMLGDISVYLGNVTVGTPLFCASKVAVNLVQDITFPGTLFSTIKIDFKYI